MRIMFYNIQNLHSSKDVLRCKFNVINTHIPLITTLNFHFTALKPIKTLNFRFVASLLSCGQRAQPRDLFHTVAPLGYFSCANSPYVEYAHKKYTELCILLNAQKSRRSSLQYIQCTCRPQQRLNRIQSSILQNLIH